MMNIMEINGYKAILHYDPEIEMFRGEFTGLNGGADFYASNIEDLKKEDKNHWPFFCQCARRME